MSGNINVLAATALALLVLMVLTWLLSLPLRNASIVDVVWGAGFVVVAWASVLTANAYTTRSNLITAMVTVWGVRLAAHLWWRNRGKGENHRHHAMRRRAGDRFVATSLVTVFLFQGLLVWIVSLPVQLAAAHDVPDIGAIGVLGVVIWGIGFFFESVGDSQLARFKADPDNEGRLLDSGLWRYSRHPNYFGDFCIWWGIFLVAAETADARFAVISPIVMTILLIHVSGVRPLERSLVKHKPGYAQYVTRTSAFFPRRPRRTS